jgi:uroporphyrinogen decarboxylase
LSISTPHRRFVQAICQRVESYYRQRALRAIEAANGAIDIIGSGGDLGEQHRLLLNPDVWREQIKPHTARLITTFKDLGLKTFYHSDGAIVPVIDDFIEIGLDILDPIQVSANGMEPQLLFDRFGSRLCFHGAIDEVTVLPKYTPTQVYDHTIRMIDTLGRHCGFIPTATHLVQGDTPAVNVAALAQAVLDYRYH